MKYVAVPLVVALFVGSGSSRSVAADNSRFKDGQPALAPTRVISEAELRQELRSHKGRPVVLHFWATWCEPCLAELPVLARLAKDVQRRGVDFVAVSLDNPSARSAQRVGSVLVQRVHDANWSSILRSADLEAFMTSIDPRWEGAIPVFFAFDGDARLRRSHLGNITRGEFESLVAGLATTRTQ